MDPTARNSSSERESQKWCQSCWSWAETDCIKSKNHQCVTASIARKFAEEKFQKVREEFILEEERFLAIAEACDYQSSGVLVGKVGYKHNSDDGWSIIGGEFSIKLAGSSATEEEIESLVEEIDGSEIKVTLERDEAASFSIEFIDLSFIKKLPRRTEGVTLPAGTILLNKSKYSSQDEYDVLVFGKEIKPHFYKDTATIIFGHVEKGLDESDINSRRTFLLDTCEESECQSRSCAHIQTGTSTISNVKFCDDD